MNVDERAFVQQPIATSRAFGSALAPSVLVSGILEDTREKKDELRGKGARGMGEGKGEQR